MKTTILIILTLIAINTNSVANDGMNQEFYLEEESFINDIPFDTWSIAMENVNFMENSGFTLEEEAYVEDIPFSTSNIASKHQMKEAMEVEFTMNAERSVDDLPFDTELVISRIKETEKTSKNLDLSMIEDNSTQSKTDFTQVQTTPNSTSYIIGIILIIIMSAYSLTAFLL